MGVVGAASFVWPLIDSMNPSAEVLALSTVEVNLEPGRAGLSPEQVRAFFRSVTQLYQQVQEIEDKQ